VTDIRELRPPTSLHESDRAPRFRPPGPRALQWMIVVLLVAGGVSFVVKGADQPADPYLTEPGRERVAGFGEIAYRLNRLPNAIRCALLAQTPEQQAKGMMNQPGFSGYDGMLFLFNSEISATFHMRDTPLPLSIAWFDSGGRFISATDMEPCIGRSDCPTHKAAAPFRYALEAPRGSLPSLGIGEGAVVSVGGPCA